MNLKRTTKLVIVPTLLIIFGLVLVSASPTQGPYVDEFWMQYIEGPDSQAIALLTHTVDAGGLPRPSDIPDLQAEGMTINSAVRLGYNMLFTNNYMYPCDDLEMRKAIIRLVDKDALDELLLPASIHQEYWLPESMTKWINRDAKLPLYDPATANDILNAAGYTYTTDPTPAGWYDVNVPGSQPYYRRDPDTGVRMADIEYVTRPQAESPLYYEHSMIICEKLHAMGIPAILTPKTWGEIVDILCNSDPGDYQLLTGVGIVWGSPAPDILYDFVESTQFPLWNVWYFQNATADYWCHQMKATLDEDELKTAVDNIQAIINEEIPYVPVMTYLTYTVFSGPHASNPGCIKIVNAVGFGAEASYNEFGKDFGESGRTLGDKDILKWYYGGVLDTLNPLMADTVPDWQLLDLVMGDGMRLNSYTHEYIWRIWTGMPDIQLWTGPGGELGMTLEYTMREGVEWHDGAAVDADDVVFALNLLRFQENERYLSTWQPIYDVVKTGDYSFKIWYLQRYLFAHEYFGVGLLAPKHIWEDFVDSPETGEPLVIDYGAGPMGGDVWTSPGRHHSEFNLWLVEHPTVDGLTCLIGTDNWIYPEGGWEPGVCFHVEAWKDAENYVPTINAGDCNLDGLVDMRDVYEVKAHQGDFSGMAFPEAIGGDPGWDPIADIDFPAQKITGDEIYTVESNFGIRWWPP